MAIILDETTLARLEPYLKDPRAVDAKLDELRETERRVKAESAAAEASRAKAAGQLQADREALDQREAAQAALASELTKRGDALAQRESEVQRRENAMRTVQADARRLRAGLDEVMK